MANKRVLVIGATGVAGSAFIDHVASNSSDFAQWSITGLSRQTTTDPSDAVKNAVNINYLCGDLLNDYTALKSVNDITHVVFAGFVPAPDFAQQVKPNRDILINCLQALERCPLERILLIQGMKYYGSHLGKFKTPAREDDARHQGENYYYAQQDVLESSGLDWTCLRPHVICGTTSIGTPQNILSVIGVYATLMRERKQPLHWPGTTDSFTAINQATDANLLARAIAYFLTNEDATAQAFNITNGDFFRWEHLWPKIADLFGMRAGAVETQDLATVMPPLSNTWDHLVQSQKLQPYTMDAITNWSFADYILRTGWDVIGFHDCLDTETMYLEHLQTLQEQRLLPIAS